LAGAGSLGRGASTGAAPAGGAAGSLVEGAAAVSVAVGLGTAVGVPLVSVFVPAVLLSLSFLRLKRALSLSITSRAVNKR